MVQFTRIVVLIATVQVSSILLFVNSFTLQSTSTSRRVVAYSTRLNVLSTDYDEVEKIQKNVASSSSLPNPMNHAYIAEQTRKDFAILDRRRKQQQPNGGDEESHQPLIYFDSAATSQKPNVVVDTLSHYYNVYNSNVHRGAHTLSREATTAYESARDKIKHFIHAAHRNEIIFTSGATDSINLISHTYGRKYMQEGDIIILSVMEHHSNLIPWQILADEKKLILKFIDIDEQIGGLDMKHLQSMLENEIDDLNKVKLISFQHVSNVLGCINPVQDIVSLIRSKCPNCKIVLDACQSVPHMIVNVQELDVDFLVASGHKMCGPTGIGFCYGKEELLNSIPPYKGGGEMIDTVTLQGSTFQLAPARFEAGTPPIAQAIGLGRAIDYLQYIGMDKIYEYEHELGQYLYEQLSQVEGISILGPSIYDNNGKIDSTKYNRAALCAFVHDTIHPSDLSTFLDMNGNVAIRAGHHCCQPLHTRLGITHSARASLYFYNTKEEIDTFVTELKNTIHFLTVGLNEDDDSDSDFVPFI